MAVLSIYVEKKQPYDVEAAGVLADLRGPLQMKALTGVRLINRYLVQGMAREAFEGMRGTVFSEPQVDNTWDSLPGLEGYRVFASEYLPGQFDQRADSCEQCISLATGKTRPTVRTAKIYALMGDITDAQFAQIRAYLINPVESREASLTVPETLAMDYEVPKDIKTIDGFISMDRQALSALLADMGFAMDLDDLAFCQEYFRIDERRDPTVTELRMIDTYWSDHCRHTTFLTHIDKVEIGDPAIKASYDKYLGLRQELYGKDTKRPVTLMDMGTIAAKALKARGLLQELDESEEINACSVKIDVDVDGKTEKWLLMFKNETHNHPTEIEPFGGAATCLGGAIRDPLSGRSYVYQAMRVTGAGNPLQRTAETLPGKLPQRKIVQTAAAGYSAYGNQIGIATGHVHEIYHPGYVAKRLEIGAVIGAAPAHHVVREQPDPGDVVILLGGRTGRDGCGGATGSSKSHTAESLQSCGAEVQKGNPPEERKLQRLFRNPEATRLIRRCNDFGAGGVSVSIGELADGVEIDLDKVPKKYEGLDGTELAISESQERMSVVVRAEDAQRFIGLSAAENLEAVVVATISMQPRLTMRWRGKTIVDLARTFLNSNGAPKSAAVLINRPDIKDISCEALDAKGLEALMAGLDACSQKGLVERFDSTIGAGTVLMPFGGRHQLTPGQAMAAKIPVLEGETNTCSLMAWGFDPLISSASPYHGGALAVVESVAKIIAAGGSHRRCWLTFQEYFERLRDDAGRWGKPAAALLGALEAQLGLGIAAIGGKDSMSGSFEDIDVPPTLVSFAVSTTDARKVLSPEFKEAGSTVYLLKPQGTALDFPALTGLFDQVEGLIASGKVKSAWALGPRGEAEGVVKMCFGNALGFAAAKPLTTTGAIGGFLLEAEGIPALAHCLLGHVIAEPVVRLAGGEEVPLQRLQDSWEATLQPVFPYLTRQEGKAPTFAYKGGPVAKPAIKAAKPTMVIPVFPGTNCEYDTARAIRRAGGEPEILVVRNRTPEDISASVDAMAKAIAGAHVVALPGGFSGGDEPDGSAKFITAFFRNPQIREAVEDLLQHRDGLMCGICNGFQALVKLGLVPYGCIRDLDAETPTLTYNAIGRHQSMLCHTRVASTKSPWLSTYKTGEVYTVAISHGEGRFIAPGGVIDELAENGQVATQYVDLQGNPTYDVRFNPNNSACAIEGITSPDGRVFGRMAHIERYGDGLFQNVPGNKWMNIFEGAVAYYG